MSAADRAIFWSITQDPSQNQPADEGDDSFSFELNLPFQVAECSQCGALITQQVCSCGAEAPALQPDPQASKRKRALDTALQRAEIQLKGFDELGIGAVPLSPDQFVLALREADLVTKVGDSYRLGSALGNLDLSDPKVIGSEARRVIEVHLDHTESILAACRELADFRPQPPADELQDLARDAGRYGVELAAALIRLLVSPEYIEATGARDRVQELWAHFPLGSDLSAALKRLEPWSVPDLDARVGLAFGRDGKYTGDAGDLEPALVFLAFSGESNPHESMANAAWRYFRPHTGLEDVFEPAASAAIIPPLVMLAASETPLRSHRMTRIIFEKAMAAFEKDSSAVRKLVRRATDEGPSIFSAQARVARALGDLKEDSSDEDAVDRVLRSYRQIAETTYRTVGWLVLGLEAIADGKSLPDEDHPPMLGPLQQQLAAGGPVGKATATGIDVDLRNTDAHVQYRWVVEREVVRDLRTKQEWTVPDLEQALHELTGTIAGIDAGYACFVTATGLGDEIPAWLHDGEAPEVSKLIADMSFGAKGFEVEDVGEGGAAVIIRAQPELEVASLFPALAGMVPFARDAMTFTVTDSDGVRLVDVQAETLRQSVQAPKSLKTLAVIAPLYESAARTGMDPKRAGVEFVAMTKKVAAVASMEDLANKELAPSAFRDLNDRLNYAATLFQSSLSLEIEDGARHAKKLGRIRATATNASRGNRPALDSLMNQLGDLAREADEVGAVWPPRVAS